MSNNNQLSIDTNINTINKPKPVKPVKQVKPVLSPPTKEIIFNCDLHILQPFINTKGEEKSIVLTNIEKKDTQIQKEIVKLSGKWVACNNAFFFKKEFKQNLLDIGCGWSDKVYEYNPTTNNKLIGIHFEIYKNKYIIKHFSSEQCIELRKIGTFNIVANGWIINKKYKKHLIQKNTPTGEIIVSGGIGINKGN